MLTRDQITEAYEKAIADDDRPAAGLDVTEADKDISRALDDCACREFMAMLADMTPEEKQKLDQFMTELRENGGNPQ